MVLMDDALSRTDATPDIPPSHCPRMLCCSALCLITSFKQKDGLVLYKLVLKVVIIRRDLYYIHIVGLPAHELGFREIVTAQLLLLLLNGRSDVQPSKGT